MRWQPPRLPKEQPIIHKLALRSSPGEGREGGEKAKKNLGGGGKKKEELETRKEGTSHLSLGAHQCRRDTGGGGKTSKEGGDVEKKKTSGVPPCGKKGKRAPIRGRRKSA